VTPERWQAVKGLLDRALERAPGERAAFLAGACGADAALRREVESLLAAGERTGGFLEPPPAAAPHLRRGETEKAREYYNRFAELWKDCDPKLRPQVIQARQMAQGRD
jgi:hypothetical protein